MTPERPLDPPDPEELPTALYWELQRGIDLLAELGAIAQEQSLQAVADECRKRLRGNPLGQELQHRIARALRDAIEDSAPIIYLERRRIERSRDAA